MGPLVPRWSQASWRLFFHFRIFFFRRTTRVQSASSCVTLVALKVHGLHPITAIVWPSVHIGERMCAGFHREFPIAACCAYAVTRQYRVDSVVEKASPGASNLSRPLFTFSVVVVWRSITLFIMDPQNQEIVASGSPAEVPNDPG